MALTTVGLGSVEGAAASRAGRLTATISAAIGTIAGVTPHVLHHIGPIAGTALLTGMERSFLFGAIGFVLTLPAPAAEATFRLLAGAGYRPGAFRRHVHGINRIGPAIRGEDSEGSEAPASDPHHSSRFVASI